MPKKEITTVLKQELALNVQTISSDTTTTSSAISTADYNGGVNIILFLGTRTDGTYTPLITECATSGGSYTAVVDADLVAQDTSSTTAPEAQAVLNTSDTTSKIGYIGVQPFIKVALVSTSTSSGSLAGALVTKLGDVAAVSA
tara:strand:+ start:7438 stop:7866 length:429 start_codon:yes stop_codon:yes gene_type:complete